MREFATGATRDDAMNKPHYVGYISWQALKRFGQYMLKHETQADGKRREPGNWKLGMSMAAYRDSLVRHTIDFNEAVEDGRLEEAEELACAILFNIQGWLHERLRATSTSLGQLPLVNGTRTSDVRLKRQMFVSDSDSSPSSRS